MNLSMVRRAIHRHRYMHDEPAYRALLEHARHAGSVWMVSQEQVAKWWRLRNDSRLELAISSPGRLTVSCPLEGTVLQLDSGDLHPLPHTLDVSVDARPEIHLGSPRSAPLASFLAEVLRHLGYGHLRLDPPGTATDEMTECLSALLDHALQHQRYDPESLTCLRKHIRQAHVAASLPDLRLWNWPHRDGLPYRAALSVRYDVDKAIVNLPRIHRLEAGFGLTSTVYLRPVGYFYGDREIREYRAMGFPHEIALHGEFETTSKSRHISPLQAARYEKSRLEQLIDGEVSGVCMHGGELHSNTTAETKDIVESAGFDYDTLFRNRYYLPLFIPTQQGTRGTLSIGQHFADISVPGSRTFSDDLAHAFEKHFDTAFSEGGIFVPVMHPLYFGVLDYLRYPANLWRMSIFLPRYLVMAGRLRKGQSYVNK